MFEVSQYLPEDRLVGLSYDKSSKEYLIDYIPTYWCPHCDVVTRFDIPATGSNKISNDAKSAFDKNTNNLNKNHKFSDFSCKNCKENVRVIYKNKNKNNVFIPAHILVYENISKRLETINDIRSYNSTNMLHGFLSGGLVSAIMCPMLVISFFLDSLYILSLLFFVPVAFWYKHVRFLIKSSKEFTKFYFISLAAYMLAGVAFSLFRDTIGTSFLLVYLIGIMIFSFVWMSSVMTEELKSKLYEFVKETDYKNNYSMVSMFNRLHQTKLYEQFKGALKRKDKERIINILMKVDYNQKEAEYRASSILKNPSSYGL